MYGGRISPELIWKAFIELGKTNVVIEAPGGFGKTFASAKIATWLQMSSKVHAVLFMSNTHKSCSKICRLISKNGGSVIWFKGITKCCARRDLLKRVSSLGLHPSLACLICDFRSRSSRKAMRYIVDALKEGNGRVVQSGPLYVGLSKEPDLCLYPAIKSVVIRLNNLFRLRHELGFAPIIVLPSQVFTNPVFILEWVSYRKRQRKPKNLYMIIDECDTLIFNPYRISIRKLEPTKGDYEVIDCSAPIGVTSRELASIIGELVDLIKRVTYRDVSMETRTFREIEHWRTRYREVFSELFRYRKKLYRTCLEKNVSSRLLNMAMELTHFVFSQNWRYMLMASRVYKEEVVLEDYNLPLSLIINKTFPCSITRKLNLTATFPSWAIMESELINPRLKSIVKYVFVYRAFHRNVEYALKPIIPTSEEVPSRIEAFEESKFELANIIEQAFRYYEIKTGYQANGAIVFLPSSKFVIPLLVALEAMGYRYYGRKDALFVELNSGRAMITYLGSRYCRSIDLPNYDIAIVCGPQLPPPRYITFYDSIDIAKAVNEAVQAIMRIVREPSPIKRKLVVLDTSFASRIYLENAPAWIRTELERLLDSIMTDFAQELLEKLFNYLSDMELEVVERYVYALA